MDCASAPILSPLAALTGQLYANAVQAQKAPKLTFAEEKLCLPFGQMRQRASHIPRLLRTRRRLFVAEAGPWFRSGAAAAVGACRWGMALGRLNVPSSPTPLCTHHAMPDDEFRLLSRYLCIAIS